MYKHVHVLIKYLSSYALHLLLASLYFDQSDIKLVCLAILYRRYLHRRVFLTLWFIQGCFTLFGTNLDGIYLSIRSRILALSKFHRSSTGVSDENVFKK